MNGIYCRVYLCDICNLSTAGVINLYTSIHESYVNVVVLIVPSTSQSWASEFMNKFLCDFARVRRCCNFEYS